MVPAAHPADVRTYYERPVLKEPTWKWYIPAYFWAGGLAAGSSLLAVGAELSGDAGLARRSRLVAVSSIGVGAACLVADLGRPERFHHMLRVVKPSSPMSVGTWLLSVYGPAAGLAAAADLLAMAGGAGGGRLGLSRRAAGRGAGLASAGRAAGWVAAVTAPGVATYTAVLLTDTAVPAWHGAGRTMPGLFVTSAASAAGGMALVAGALAGAEPYPATVRLAIGGVAAEGIAAQVVERTLDPAVRQAWESGPARTLSRLAAGLGAVGAAGVLASQWGSPQPRGRRWLVGVGGAMIAAASACERFAVLAAGRASAANPRATIGP
ncbi:MAG TPA: NrfD/PsrC family molybdoenzyme membrane anchor subunit, partial [Acidimicrobiales bacterium]